MEKRGLFEDRRLKGAIRTEIEDSFEIYGVDEDGIEVDLDGVAIEYDSAGNRVIYVILTSENEIYKVPVTGHFHDMDDSDLSEGMNLWMR